ncbi:hypothetical protein G6F46_001819 [Rhizopus delemar]|nr:hypothetical protein G6F55_000397 [Rhizopus delemar]KAG1552193.1 hypothetical protein G6F51_001374 [Rhizopus arrhizus]KAG1503992.1 hypothetical protein G6F54_001303 [Rhizopus delemar]KAG1518422.1 hypothetical protein G6F53_000610 [Rhizopus delemar]KAG1526268.1 hypothetical protein G6F52_002584 [Rhizopus delemar]
MPFNDRSSINDFNQYYSNPRLTEPIMLANDQENNLTRAEDLSQLNEKHLQTNPLEYQLNYPSFHNHMPNMQGYLDRFPEQHADLGSFPSGMEPSSLLTPEFQYAMFENASIASSPSLDFFSVASPSTDFCTLVSNSPPDLPFFPPPTPPSTKPTKKKHKTSMKRTLSYENIMELNTVQPKPSPPQKKLNHEKVMEALRAKLKKSASPKAKPAPQPVPPPNTNPTTGVLFLDLKHRRRKIANSSKRLSHKSI